MIETHDHGNPSSRFNSNLIGRCTLSCIFVFLTHLALSLIPRFFSSFSILIQLALSTLLLLLLVGFGGWFRRTLLRARASAPAFVFFNIIFIWGFYFSVIRPGNLNFSVLGSRKAVPMLRDAVFNCGVLFIFVGLYSIMKSDPGIVANESAASSDQPMESSASRVNSHEELESLASDVCHESSEGSRLFTRLRYCKTCKAYIKRLDHHCPAFGNCIGQNNHPLFLVLLFGFIGTEASYLACSSLFAAEHGILDNSSSKVRVESTLTLSESLAVSTILFTILQLVWQVVFVIWHIYCVCTNIRTDEWINWMKYPEFQLVTQLQPGQSFTYTRFRNPYNKGIVQNVKEFLALGT